MTCSIIQDRLDAYADDELDAARRAEVEAHLATCDGCRSELGQLRELAERVRALPRGREPARDLLPGIRRGVGNAGGQRTPPRVGTWWLAVAASLMLVALSGVLLVREWPRRGAAGDDPAVSGAVPAGDVTLHEFREAERQYAEASQALLSAIGERADEMSPETRALLDENLRIIDAAIEEVRAALEADPGNPGKGHSLNALYDQKIQLLWTISRMSS